MSTLPDSTWSSPAPGHDSRLRPAPLPSPLTPLIGRERELALASALLLRDDVRLLTIAGPGGIGKTRLATEIGHAASSVSFDQVFFIPLAPVSEPARVSEAIMRALGVSDVLGVTGRGRFTTTFGDGSTLLILDTFEHLLSAAPLLNELLSDCPNLKLVVTSRSLVRLAGEYALPVPPLELPGHDHRSLDVIARSPAVRLFVDRVQAVTPSFALSGEIAPAVAAICRHLDGLPLAIELAAAQSAVLPPAALLARIEAKLPLPVPGPRDAPKRLRTINDAVAWSYELLSPDDQRLFRQVSVFSGGFALEAAEFMSGADALDDISSLVDRNLIKQREWEGEARFVMLETIRVFAWNQAVSAGESDALADAHADWALRLAEPAALAAVLPGQRRLLSRLEIEHQNFCSALTWLYQRGDSERLLHLCGSLNGHWIANGHVREGREWLERALERSPADSSLARGLVLLALGRVLTMFGEVESAEPLLMEAVSTLRMRGESPITAFALIHLGAAANQLGAYERAEDLLNSALQIGNGIDDISISGTITGSVLANLGVAAHGRGDLELARARFKQALLLCQEQSYMLGTIRTLRDLGDIERDRGDYQSSIEHYRASLKLLGEQNDVRVVVDALEGAAVAAANWQQPAQAARFLGAAEALRMRNGGAFLMATDVAAHERALALIHADLNEADIDIAWATGHSMSLHAAIAEIQALAPIETASGPIDRAAITFTPREMDVARLLVAGLSDRAIADSLFLSVRTVEAHVARILAKLGVRSRTAAVSVAVGAGLVRSESETHV